MTDHAFVERIVVRLAIFVAVGLSLSWLQTGKIAPLDRALVTIAVFLACIVLYEFFRRRAPAKA